MTETEEKITLAISGDQIPGSICQLTAAGFNSIYESLLQRGESLESAYEILEKSHIQIFKHRRYSSYDSFRKTRSRRIKN